MTTSTLQIRTPEGIVFSQEIAGPVTRFLAWMLDAVCVYAILYVLTLVLRLLSIFSDNLSTALQVLGFFVISIGYGIACEWYWRGQTVGKRLYRLRVVDAEGLRLHFSQIVLRNLLRAVDGLPLFYFLGGLVCWFTPKCQRLGDIAGNTLVIHQPELAEPNLDQLLAGKFNSLRAYPHLAARLRQLVAPGEAAIALQAVLRRDTFDAVSRVELFAELAGHFRAKVTFPAEATEGITDEQFIRNVVDVVYRSRVENKPAVTA